MGTKKTSMLILAENEDRPKNLAKSLVDSFNRANVVEATMYDFGAATTSKDADFVDSMETVCAVVCGVLTSKRWEEVPCKLLTDCKLKKIVILEKHIDSSKFLKVNELSKEDLLMFKHYFQKSKEKDVEKLCKKIYCDLQIEPPK